MSILTTRRTVSAAMFAGVLLGESQALARPANAKRFVQVNRLRAKTGKEEVVGTELHAMKTLLTGATRYDVLREDRVPGTFWTIEIWPTRATHDHAVLAPEIQAGIDRCKQVISEFENVVTLEI